MTQIILITFFLLPYLGLRASNHLFEPKEAVINSNVGHWSRYCKSNILVKNRNNFCKVWIGIRWNNNASQFQYERNGKPIKWHNFKYPDINNLRKGAAQHQCKYGDYPNRLR